MIPADFALATILPGLWLSAAGLGILLGALALGKAREAWLFDAAQAALVVGMALQLAVAAGGPRGGFFSTVTVDPFSTFFGVLVQAAGFVSLLLARRFVAKSPYSGGELAALVLFATVGMVFMASGTDLVTLYIGLETMALSTYVLAGYFKGEPRSTEAAVKYFVLGGLSSGVLLYGLSIVYGTTGTTSLAGISAKLAAEGTSRYFALGLVFVVAGLLFKVAAAPFHVWVPDVYEGAPTPVTAFFSVGPKAAAFAFVLRLLIDAFAPARAEWSTLFAVAAGLTMIWGNVAALLQTNVKRLLAYSSIAHAGYALLGIVAFDREFGLPGILYALLAYTFMNLGAFGLVILLESKGYAAGTVDDFRGLSRRHPWAAAAMLLFLLSLAGIPPTAGFFAKYLLFAGAIRAGAWPLAVIAVVTSAISLFYYLRIGAAMYLRDAEAGEEPSLPPSPSVGFALAVCALVTIVAGVFPAPFLDWVRSSLPLAVR